LAANLCALQRSWLELSRQRNRSQATAKYNKAVLKRSRFPQVEVVVWTRARAGGGQIQFWNNNLFEFSMIPDLPDSFDPS